jgi:hypothetical protein
MVGVVNRHNLMSRFFRFLKWLSSGFKFRLLRLVLCLSPFLLVELALAQEVPKAPAPLILAHYMPWFVAKPSSPVWEWHWTMGAFDPEGKVEGERRLASHYTPLIGAYDSADPDVIEYHLLTMKLAGVDGLIVDWYGLSNQFDYAILRRNSELLLRAAERYGLRIGICYEDQTVTHLEKAGILSSTDRVKHVQGEIDWLQKNWFASPAYLELNGQPVLLSFGSDGLSDSEWKQALAAPRDGILYLSEHVRRSSAAGAFDWPSRDNVDSALDNFYNGFKAWPVAMPVAFPRFHDIYGEAKVRDNYKEIPDDEGKRYESTLRRALLSGAPVVQLVTWNDWGEGTFIEPSLEFGCRDLETTQRLRRELVESQFSNQAADLKLPYRLFQLRKKGVDKAKLDRIAALVSAGESEAADKLIQQLEG